MTEKDFSWAQIMKWRSIWSEARESWSVMTVEVIRFGFDFLLCVERGVLEASYIIKHGLCHEGLSNFFAGASCATLHRLTISNDG